MTVGRTVMDTRTHAPWPPNARVAFDADARSVCRTARRDARTRVKRRRQLLALAIVAEGSCCSRAAAGSTDPLQAVRAAATNTLALTAESTLQADGRRPFGETSTVVGRGEFSFPKGLGYEGLQLSSHGWGGRHAYLVFLPARVWIRPVSSAALPEGDLWISTRLTDAQSGGAQPQALALVLEGTNPEPLLEEIATGAAAASASGQQRRRSRAVHRVRRLCRPGASVDATSKGPLRIAMRQQLAALRAAGLGSRIQIAVSVDGAERLAQLEPLPGSQLGTTQIELRIRQSDPTQPSARIADGGHRIAEAHAAAIDRTGCSGAIGR